MTAETTPSSVPAIQLRDPRDVVGVIPAMLGFHPERSVVLLCIGGPRRQVLLTLRADLPTRAMAGSARELVDRALKAGAEAIVAVVYSEDQPAGGRADGLPYRRLVREVTTACETGAIELLDVLFVGDGRWWSYRCDEPSCCPPEGNPLPDEPSSAVTHFQAESVARGARVWPRRADLAASIAPLDAVRCAELEDEFGAVENEYVRRVVAGETDQLRVETVHLFRDLHVGYRDGTGAIDVSTAARLAIGLHDVCARDEVLAWGGGAHPGALLALLTDLVRTVPPPVDPPAATVLAWVAYQAGDGALAQCALDRATATDPTYNLAVLLQHALDNAVRPTELAEVLRMAEDVPRPTPDLRTFKPGAR